MSHTLDCVILRLICFQPLQSFSARRRNLHTVHRRNEQECCTYHTPHGSNGQSMCIPSMAACNHASNPLPPSSVEGWIDRLYIRRRWEAYMWPAGSTHFKNEFTAIASGHFSETDNVSLLGLCMAEDKELDFSSCSDANEHVQNPRRPCINGPL